MKHILILVMFVFCCISPLVVSAQETAGHKGEAAAVEHEETIGQAIGKWINFFALAGILYVFLWRKIRVQDKFKAESDEIRKAIESARAAKEEAEKTLHELEERLEQMNADVSRIKEHSAREVEEEKRRILESAHREAERIIELAHREIDSEVRAARQLLQKQVADIAVSRGRQIIQGEINDQDHVGLIDRYIEEFGK